MTIVNPGDEILASNVNEKFMKDGSESFNGTLYPDTTGARDLGTSLKIWQNAYIQKLNLIESFTAGENVSAGELCYLKSDGKMWKADADAEATSSLLLAIAVDSILVNNTGNFLLWGRYTTTGLTAGSKYFVSGTAGGITLTAPTASLSVVRIVGYALSTTILLFMPDTAYVVN